MLPKQKADKIRTRYEDGLLLCFLVPLPGMFSWPFLHILFEAFPFLLFCMIEGVPPISLCFLSVTAFIIEDEGYCRMTSDS